MARNVTIYINGQEALKQDSIRPVRPVVVMDGVIVDKVISVSPPDITKGELATITLHVDGAVIYTPEAYRPTPQAPAFRSGIESHQLWEAHENNLIDYTAYRKLMEQFFPGYEIRPPTKTLR